MTALPAPETLASPRRVSLAVIALVACGLILSVLQRGVLAGVAQYPVHAAEIFVFDLEHWALWLALAPLVVLAARRWPLRPSPARGIAAHLIIATLLAAVHTAGLSALLQVTLGGSEESFLRSAASLLSWRLAADGFVYATMVTAVLALDAAARARAEEVAALRASEEATRARMESLQLQIQPHFLFNTLNTAAMLARSGSGAPAATVLGQLSAMLREVIRDPATVTTSLRSELDFVDSYLAIERTRFGERLRVTKCIAEDALEVRVPRLLLQPLIENAVRHGLATPAGGNILISANTDADSLTIFVEDDGIGIERRGSTGERVGLGNTRARLSQLYGSNFDLDLTPSRRNPSGAVTTVRIPIQRFA